MCRSLFNHSLTEGHLGSFPFLAVTDKATAKIHVQVLVWTGRSLGWMSSGAVAGQCGNCRFSFISGVDVLLFQWSMVTLLPLFEYHCLEDRSERLLWCWCCETVYVQQKNTMAKLLEPGQLPAHNSQGLLFPFSLMQCTNTSKTYLCCSK